jgi:hypothetical protein
VALDKDGVPRFQLLQQWQKRPTAPVVLYLFDLLWSDGRDITSKRLLQKVKGGESLPDLASSGVSDDRAKSGHIAPKACFTSTLLCPTVLPPVTTLGFRPSLAENCKNTTRARTLQQLPTFRGDLLRFYLSLRHAGSSDTSKVVQAERFFDVTTTEATRKVAKKWPSYV